MAKKENLPATPFERSEEEAALVGRYRERKGLPPPRFTQFDEKTQTLTIQVRDIELFDAQLTKATGIVNETFSLRVIVQVASVLSRDDDTLRKLNNAAALLHEINPQDEMEGMLSAQMISTHDLAMEFLRKAALKEQTGYGVELYANHATKLLRTYAAQMEALTRYRAKGQQKVVVEHVSVNAGGQAIVGVVEGKSGGRGGSGKN